MKCKICTFEAPHPRAISDHWKAAHPAEYKKRLKERKAKLAARQAPPADEIAPDSEVETMMAMIAAIEVVDSESEEPVHDVDARVRILLYVAARVGVKMIAAPAHSDAI